MEPNNNPWDHSGAQTQEPDIPVLKPKKEEKKGAGIVLPGGAAPGVSSMSGGAVVGASKSGLMGLLAGKMGVAAAALGLGGAGLVGYGFMQQSGPAKPEAAMVLESPDAMISSRKRSAQGSKSLAFMQRAAEGEIKWDKDGNRIKDAAGASEGGDGVDENDAPVEDPGMEMPDAEALLAGAGGVDGVQDGKKRLNGGLSGSKLSTSLGGGFGKNNIFSGGGGMKMKEMSKLGQVKDLQAARRGKSKALKRNASSLSAKKISTRGIGANRAMGQLKFAGRRSAQAAEAGEAGTQRTYGADAFDQTNTTGGAGAGEQIGGGLTGGEEVNAPGGGAPDVTGGGGGYVPPDVGQAGNATPYQGLVDNAQQSHEMAKLLMGIGFALIVLGAALVWAFGTGAILIGIGVGLVVAGLMMQQQAENQGTMIKDQYGQEKQGEIIERHGTNSGNRVYKGPRDKDINMDNTIQEDVAEERDATYQME